ncbi:DUF3817 domain-containing protein [Lentibacter sp. XHP0401]|jgi:integral membrane protein|uniref:DUF3817 domain-containing protein n=1 Tax=Lentibacter sp. XHP0401 TaxID=2984334 RepID=UPI0021E9AD3B|nr:DUF3817 domain-containing protein [Lentibacter sp. XHP0401]MCV2892963.1 DUF3817 domain-containing protein [Lentibacter sp. XHP0401]
MKALRITAFAEAVTLILLVCVAVPLKYGLGLPGFVSALGPVHGAAFIGFLVVTMYALGEGLVTRSGALRLFIGSLIPFGGFINERWLARQAAGTPAK